MTHGEIVSLCQVKVSEMTLAQCQKFVDNHCHKNFSWRNRFAGERKGQYNYNMMFHEIEIPFPELFYSENDSDSEMIGLEMYVAVSNKLEVG